VPSHTASAGAAPDAEAPAPASLLDIISAPADAAIASNQSGTAGLQLDPILALLSTSALPTSFSSDARVPQRATGDSTPAQASPAAPAPAVRLDRDIIKFVVQRLGRHTPREDVIRELTRSRRMAWADAHRLVAEVERKHVRSIAFRRGPFYIFLSLVSIVGGLGLTIFGRLACTIL